MKKQVEKKHDFITAKPLSIEDAVQNGIVGRSGKVYKFCSELSVDRYEQQEIYAEWMQFGLDAEGMYKKIVHTYNLLNAMKVADASVELSRLREAPRQMMNRARPAMKIVALYFNYEGEDSTKVNEAEIQDKINDWTGYQYEGFFVLATSFVRLRMEKLNESLEKIAQKPVAEVLKMDKTPKGL